MKKVLLGGMLIAGLFAQAANAGDMAGVSGKGCAIATAGTVIPINLVGGIEDLKHGALQAGTIFSREATFTYDVRDVVGKCGGAYVQLKVDTVEKMEDGVTFMGSTIKSDQAGVGVRANVVTIKDATREGSITLKVKYMVDDPSKLTGKFRYFHKFNMEVKALAVNPTP